MDILDQSFDAAVEIVNNLKKKPSDEELLEIYGLFKQSKFGDNNETKPNFLNFKGCAKWEAWNKLKGKTQIEAKQLYITKATSLFNEYGK